WGRGGRAGREGRGRAPPPGRRAGGRGPLRRPDGRPARERRPGNDPPRLAAAGMKGSAAPTTTAPLVDEFLERLRVEDGSSALTIAAYRRDLARLDCFLRKRRR